MRTRLAKVWAWITEETGDDPPVSVAALCRRVLMTRSCGFAHAFTADRVIGIITST